MWIILRLPFLTKATRYYPCKPTLLVTLQLNYLLKLRSNYFNPLPFPYLRCLFIRDRAQQSLFIDLTHRRFLLRLTVRPVSRNTATSSPTTLLGSTLRVPPSTGA